MIDSDRLLQAVIDGKQFYPDIQEYQAFILSQFSSEMLSTFLLKYAQDDPQNVARAISVALCHHTPNLLSILETGFQHTKPDIRSLTLFQLEEHSSRLTDEEKRALETRIMELLNNETDGDVRCEAVQALCAIDTTASLPLIQDIMNHDPSFDWEGTSIRDFCRSAIKQLSPQAQTEWLYPPTSTAFLVMEEIEFVLQDDDDREDRGLLLDLCQQLETSELAFGFQNLARSKNLSLACEAIAVIRRLHLPNQDEIFLEALAHQDDDVRRVACEEIAELGPDALSSLELALLKLLETESSDDVRYEAVNALGEIGTVRSLDLLAEISVTDTSVDYEGRPTRQLAKSAIDLIQKRQS
jgi:HEAT repeat protein